MMDETATGLAVLQVSEAEQALEPEGIVQVETEADRVPDITPAWQEVPFQVVPEAQLAVSGSDGDALMDVENENLNQ